MFGMRITLDEAAFRKLVARRPLYHQTLMGEQLEIVLDNNIGWLQILKAVEAANREWKPAAE